MKVKNLYFGNISEVVDVDFAQESSLQCKRIPIIETKGETILLKLDNDPSMVKDLYGGKYPIKKKGEYIGIYEQFASNLEQDTVSKILGDYPKESISKRRLLQLYKDYCKNK